MSFVMSAPSLPLLANKNKAFPRHGKVSALLDVLLDVVLVALLDVLLVVLVDVLLDVVQFALSEVLQDVALVALSDVLFVLHLLSRRAFLVFSR